MFNQIQFNLCKDIPKFPSYIHATLNIYKLIYFDTGNVISIEFEKRLFNTYNKVVMLRRLPVERDASCKLEQFTLRYELSSDSTLTHLHCFAFPLNS